MCQLFSNVPGRFWRGGESGFQRLQLLGFDGRPRSPAFSSPGRAAVNPWMEWAEGLLGLSGYAQDVFESVWSCLWFKQSCCLMLVRDPPEDSLAPTTSLGFPFWLMVCCRMPLPREPTLPDPLFPGPPRPPLDPARVPSSPKPMPLLLPVPVPPPGPQSVTLLRESRLSLL